MSGDSKQSLSTRWRELAASVRHFNPGASALLERCADELDAETKAHSETTLSLEQAARTSGYSADHLGRLIRQGKLQNVGRKHAPRVREADLPRKPALPPALDLVPQMGVSSVGRFQRVRQAIKQGGRNG
jgi:hypothetical protein